MADRLVVLSINAVPSYALLARRCIDGIRAAGTRLPIVLFATRGAEIPSGLPGVEVVTTEAGDLRGFDLERWTRLATVAAERVLCVDADTVCSRPLESLFDRYVERDFYAREDPGSQRDGRTYRIGPLTVAPQVDWAAFMAQKTELGVADLPVFNCGIMLFNHGACLRIGRYLHRLREAWNRWTSGDCPYPCDNRHIVGQLAASVMLGAVPDLRWGTLRREDAPFYCEEQEAPAAEPVITHVWTGLYRAYLRERGAAGALAEYEEHLRRDCWFRIALAKEGRVTRVWSAV